VSTIEELLGRNSSGSGLENPEYGHGDSLRWPRDTLYPQKLVLTSSTSGSRSVGIVRLRTKAIKVFCFCVQCSRQKYFVQADSIHQFRRRHTQTDTASPLCVHFMISVQRTHIMGSYSTAFILNAWL
jgi:hypothetical protein